VKVNHKNWRNNGQKEGTRRHDNYTKRTGETEIRSGMNRVSSSEI